MEKTVSHYRIPAALGEGWPAGVLTSPHHKNLLLWIAIGVILVLARSAAAVAPSNPPILISESTSTRAIALESISFTPEPFGLYSHYGGRSDERTRIMVFAMNLALQPGEDLSVVSADAEDAAHRHYPLTVESIRPVPSYEWISAVVFKLNDELGEVGDVLVSVSYRSAISNRVRIGIGNMGGGPADDVGAVPTPAPPYTISGQLTGSGGQGLSGVSLTLSGAQTGTAITDAGGFYSFTVTKVGDYTIAPATTTYYTFVPQTFINLHLNQIANFAGILRSYTVSGRVTAGPDPAAGLVVPLTGSQTGAVTTNSNGEYLFSLSAGGNYTITPSLNHFDFSPVSIVIADLSSDRLNLNFSGTRHTFAISGKVGDQSGKELPGITVNLTGARQATTMTDGSGNYQFTAVPAGFDYTVTPLTNAYYSFTSRSLTDLSMNQTANFAGTLRNYTVSGWLTLGPDPASFLEVPVSGSKNTSFTTDADGRYSISLPAGGNYTITPSARYFAFSPLTQVVTDLTSDQINRLFIGTRQTYTIDGRLIDESGNGLAGMTVHLVGAILNEPWMRVTDQNGHYEFASLPGAYDFNITPESTAAYVFQAHNFIDLDRNQTFDFTGLRRLALSGKVRDPTGNGIFGIRVTLGGSENGTTITTADGSYSLTATARGDYTVTPSIPQEWYTFAPAAAQFNHLDGAHSTDFTATFGALPNPAYVLEFDGQPKTVDYGNFWQEGVDLGHFFWEFWAMPGSEAAATYMLSDGYGGAHALLFGVGSYDRSEPNRYELLGNIFDGVKFDNYFGSAQGPAVGEWAHFAVGWDGQNIITYYNGVPVGKTPFAGPRRTPGPGNGGGRLLIGGSDHSNFDGRIAQVRGYEGTNPREDSPGGVEASFAPQTVFGREGNLLSYYFRSGGVSVADLSRGYNGISHSGWVRGTLAGILPDCGGCPPPKFVMDPSAPNFVANTPPPPLSGPSPPAITGGALVFDSFSRANSTYLFGSRGGLGSTEGGSAGTQVWQTNQPAVGPQPFGILNSIAVLLGNDTAIAWVPTGSATGKVDVRADRMRGRWSRGIDTGLSFRVVDANNFFFAYTTEAGAPPNSQIVKLGYYLNGQRTDLATSAALPANWTTLRVVTTDAGVLKVYADDTLVYSGSSSLLATAIGAGLYNNRAGLALVNTWDNFAVYNAP